MVPSTDERAPDWRDQAACRSVTQEMVPADDDSSGVQLAKKVCHGCPVLISCLMAAEKIGETHGREYAQGVWGGLTAQERDTMVGLNRWPAPCTSCGLECVPINLSITECSACKPKATILTADYREQITDLVALGRSYEEIARRLRLRKATVTRACGLWKLKSAKRSSSGRQWTKPCGTEAAKARHHRLEKKTGNPADGFKACPICKHVKWKNRDKKRDRSGRVRTTRRK